MGVRWGVGGAWQDLEARQEVHPPSDLGGCTQGKKSTVRTTEDTNKKVLKREDQRGTSMQKAKFRNKHLYKIKETFSNNGKTLRGNRMA